MDPDPQAEYARRFALRGMQSTDVIAFRCAAEQLTPWVNGKRALDLGCGAGRSTQFLHQLGANAYGVDHNPEMIARAQSQAGQKNQFAPIRDGEPLPFGDGSFDLIFSSWMLLEMSDPAKIIRLLKECRRVLRHSGRAIFIVNTADFYAGRWVSIDVNFPANKPPLQNGQAVKARLLPENIVVSDTYWAPQSYRHFFEQANFQVRAIHHPLGTPEDGIVWQDEAHTPPFAVYELTA